MKSSCLIPVKLVYVELLDLSALWRWLRSVWPDKRKFLSSTRLYVFDITPAGRLVVWLLKTFFRFSIDVLSFSMVDVRDLDGISVYANVEYHDLRQFREFLLLRVSGQRFWRETRSHGRMAAYLLKKRMCEYDFPGDGKYNQDWHVFTMLHVLEWHRRSLGHEGLRASLWIKSRPFMAELQKSAASYNVDLFEDRMYRVCGIFRIIGKLFRMSPQVIWRILLFRLRCLLSYWFKVQMPSVDEISNKAYLFVDYYGHLNLDKLEYLSDLFFLSNFLALQVTSYKLQSHTILHYSSLLSLLETAQGFFFS